MKIEGGKQEKPIEQRRRQDAKKGRFIRKPGTERNQPRMDIDEHGEAEMAGRFQKSTVCTRSHLTNARSGVGKGKRDLNELGAEK
jgi:hypothetical protein